MTWLWLTHPWRLWRIRRIEAGIRRELRKLEQATHAGTVRVLRPLVDDPAPPAREADARLLAYVEAWITKTGGKTH